MFDIMGFINQSRRVMNVATLPRQKEFTKICKITALGIILIGLIGVTISFLLNLVQ
jgi:protein translocase SEC61 complex gamma subunit